MACRQGYSAVVDVLLSNGANVNTENCVRSSLVLPSIADIVQFYVK